MSPLLLAYPGNEPLAAGLRRALPADPLAFEMRRFPDGETYVRIDGDVQARDVVLLCTLHGPDAKLLPLVFMADTLHELGARSVGLVSPYLAYMRQDRRFRAGEAVSSASFAHVISEHFDWLVTVDPPLAPASVSRGDLFDWHRCGSRGAIAVRMDSRSRCCTGDHWT